MPQESPLPFWIRALNRTGLIRHLNLQTQVQAGGRTFRTPVTGGVGIGLGRDAEPWLLDALRVGLALRQGVFVDIGVNLGQTLLKFVALREGTRPYVGFEPNPSSFVYAEQLVRANALEGVTLVPVGLSEHDAVLTLQLGSDHDPAASLVAGFRADEEYRGRRYVSVFAGAPLLDALAVDRVGVVKVDVEGAEVDVLSGLEPRLALDRPLIFCEVLPTYEEATERGQMRRGRTDRLEALLHRLDYRVFRLHHDGRAEPLDTIVTHGDLDLSDYAFVPADLATTFTAHFR